MILLDEGGRVLLFLVRDPLDDKPSVWVTPGGGIEPGESPAEAAARELFEETGLLVEPADLGRPVAVTRGEWVFRGQRLYSEDWFFLWRTRSFEPETSGWTELEHAVHRGFRWWSPEGLDALDDPVLPSGLAGVVRAALDDRLGAETVELPWLFPGAE